MMWASSGGPDDWSVAWVVDGSVDGFTICVAGMWRMKRAAEAAEAVQTSVSSEDRMLEGCAREVEASSSKLKADGCGHSFLSGVRGIFSPRRPYV